MDSISLDPVTVLHGHVSPDTAYLVPDYPYGHTLRCQIRYWIATAARGAKRGQQRFVSQTTNPKVDGAPWNRPHPGRYGPRVWMYLDGSGHVKHTAISRYGIPPAQNARLRLIGVYDQISDADRTLYHALLQASQSYPEPWQEWDAAIALIAEQLAATGQPPALDNGFITAAGQRRYLGTDDYPIAVATALRRLGST